MKVIFLDMDGVLNNRKSLTAAANNAIFPTGNATFHTVDPDCVNRLRKLVEATDAKIVVSSTWRMFMDEVYRAFNWCDWKDVPIIGRTGKFGARGAEIDAWLKSNPEVTQYVILDDDSFDIHQKTHFVKTEHELGLTDDDCTAAQIILNS
jgi:hypothetical protein